MAMKKDARSLRSLRDESMKSGGKHYGSLPGVWECREVESCIMQSRRVIWGRQTLVHGFRERRVGICINCLEILHFLFHLSPEGSLGREFIYEPIRLLHLQHASPIFRGSQLGIYQYVGYLEEASSFTPHKSHGLSAEIQRFAIIGFLHWA